MGCMDAGEDGDGDGMYTSTRRDGREEMEAGAHVYTGVGCCGDRAWEVEREEEGAEDMYYTRYNSRSRGMAGRDGSCGSSRGRKRACRVKESKEGG